MITPSTRRRRTTRRGFTLIELMVTVFLLGVGLAGLVATSGAVSRMMGGSSREATAATVAASRFETLRGAACASIVAGTATTRGVSESWRADPPRSKRSCVSFSASGAITGSSAMSTASSARRGFS